MDVSYKWANIMMFAFEEVVAILFCIFFDGRIISIMIWIKISGLYL